MNKQLIICSCAALMLMGCNNKSVKNSSSMLDGQWTITEIDGVAIDVMNIPSEMQIVVDKKMFSSNAGCNSMTGTFNLDSIKGDLITFKMQGITRMSCPDMENEQRLQAVYEKIAKYSVDTVAEPKTVTFFDDTKVAVLKLSFLKGNSAEEWSLKGKWNIKSVSGIDIENTEAACELNFDLQNNIFNGIAGCNSLGGVIELGDYTLKFDDVNLTEMSCDDNSMKVEDSIVKALNSTRIWSVENGELHLENENGEVVMVLYRN